MAAEGQALSGSGVSRRRTPRYAVQAPLDVIVLRSGIPDKVPGRSVNLSERGIGAVLAAELMPGEAVGVELRLWQQREPFRSRALVRYQDKLRCGMEFSGLSSAQQAAIRVWAEELRAEPAPEPAAASSPAAEAAAEPGTNHDDKGVKRKDRDRDVAKPAGAAPPRGPSSRGRGILWKILLPAVAILLVAFWWRWNRGWEDLESGLANRQEAAIDLPQLQVPAEEMQELVIHRVDPDYPAAARQANLQGVIALDVIVGKDGSVVSLRPLNGPEVLARSAMDALRWWKFEPYRVNGVPVVVETTVAVAFKP